MVAGGYSFFGASVFLCSVFGSDLASSFSLVAAYILSNVSLALLFGLAGCFELAPEEVLVLLRIFESTSLLIIFSIHECH